MTDTTTTPDPADAVTDSAKAARRVTAAQMPMGALVQIVPVMAFVGDCRTQEGTTLPVVRIETPTGATVVALSPDQAIHFAMELRECAMKCKSGLVVPQGGGGFVLP